MTFTNRLSLGISVNKSGASKIHETGTTPYTGGSRLNPNIPLRTGDQSVKRIVVPPAKKK